jgi:hypothetical protein
MDKFCRVAIIEKIFLALDASNDIINAMSFPNHPQGLTVCLAIFIDLRI